MKALGVGGAQSKDIVSFQTPDLRITVHGCQGISINTQDRSIAS